MDTRRALGKISGVVPLVQTVDSRLFYRKGQGKSESLLSLGWSVVLSGLVSRKACSMSQETFKGGFTLALIQRPCIPLHLGLWSAWWSLILITSTFNVDQWSR